jgi:hypothetical protein
MATTGWSSEPAGLRCREPCPIARSAPTECDQSLSVKVGEANFAELFAQNIQAECFGPAGTLAKPFHIGEMKIDKMAEGNRFDAAACARLSAAINPW